MEWIIQIANTLYENWWDVWSEIINTRFWYIILLIVDQYAAHESIKLERLQNELLDAWKDGLNHQIRHPHPPTVSQFKMQTKTWFFDKMFTSSRVQNNFTESGQILSNNYEITHLFFVTLSFTQLWKLQQRFMSSLKVYLNEQHMMYLK